MRRLVAAVLLLPLLLCAGCASIMTGFEQPVSFKSQPSAADVLVKGQKVGVTPLVANIRKGKDTTVVVRKAGYVDDSFKLETAWNYWMLGNLIFLNATPFVSTTERKNGSNVEYAPDHYYSVLDPVDSPDLAYPVVARRARVARFLSVCNAGLSRDLAAGRGEYVDALWQVAAVPEERREAVLKALRDARNRNAVLPAFTESAVRILVP